MLKNYFTVAMRNLLRNKTFTAINIAGLAVGIAVFLLIFEYVAAEWNTNRFHKNFASLYRMGTLDKKGRHDVYLPPGFIPVIKSKVAGIESLVRISDDIGSGVVSFTDNNTHELKTFREENICFADSNFLEVFSFPMVAGTASLNKPHTLVLTETKALQMFGSTAVSGKTVTISNQFGTVDYTIAGVFKSMAGQSDLNPNILLSLNTLESAAGRDGNDWADPATLDNGFVNGYLVAKKGQDPGTLAAEINRLVHAMQPSTADNEVVLQPFSELHLAPAFSYPYQTFGNLKLVVMLLAISMLILLIAWVNYINLSTVQAMKRAKETGVRKVMGASRTQLSLQYLTETFVITLFSVCISFVLVQLLQNLFNIFTGKALSLGILNHGWFWLDTCIFILTGSLLSGGYVAFVLSSFKPAIAIRGKIASRKSGISFRQGLVVFQFTISLVFIISTMILYRQLQYMKTTDLGLNLTQLLIIKGPSVSGTLQKSLAFKNDLSQLSFVKKYAASNDIPGKGYNFSADGITRPGPQKGDEKKSYHMFIADEHFFDTYGIKLAEGTAFSAAEAALGWSKAKKIILNERAAAELGFAKNERATGQTIFWAGKPYEVAGGVKDYHHLSLQTAIEPIVFLPAVSAGYFTLQTGSGSLSQKISTLNALYNKYYAGNPFEYFFADETFNRQYAAEQQLGNIFIAAAIVAIVIACLGLFGLAAFTAQQRTKEIGIRKVLGASVTSIAMVLSIDFIKLVLIAIVIASPLAWWAGSNWLRDFAYRTQIGWWMFVTAGGIAVLIAVLTVSSQAIKAAVANPVKSLRTE